MNTFQSSEKLNSSDSSRRINLQPIPLPVFTRRLDEFNSFKSQFIILIHDNKELTDSEKLFYLRGSLKGESKTIETPDDSYSSLFQALEKRYENKRMLVDFHIKSILNLPTVKHESAKDLRYFLDCLNKNLRSLKILNFERDKLSKVLFLNIILEKLNRESRKQYELTLKDNEVPDFDEFLNWLERRNQILNSINSNVVVKLNQETPKSFFVKNNKPTKNYRVCNLIHPIYHCEKFKEMTLADRLEIVKRFKLFIPALTRT
ncbi:DUF1758 domain-containing protein [Nephila pilipes]|uniref:DUF1758 domain-containing protein n=1 Tax=Nephila pilipes TaxID=299642 RepID=A0A8X6MCQ3_NEPPI|nr:DUF1758 domain-containing protein [Nephila pilipes]